MNPVANPLLLLFPPELAIIRTNIRPEGNPYGDGVTRRSLADVILRMADPLAQIEAVTNDETNEVTLAINVNTPPADTGIILRACRIVRETQPNGKAAMKLVPPALNRSSGAYFEKVFESSGDLKPHGQKLWKELEDAVVARWTRERKAQVAAAGDRALVTAPDAGVPVTAEQLAELGIE